jgi:hypothetical protein
VRRKAEAARPQVYTDDRNAVYVTRIDDDFAVALVFERTHDGAVLTSVAVFPIGAYAVLLDRPDLDEPITTDMAFQARSPRPSPRLGARLVHSLPIGELEREARDLLAMGEPTAEVAWAYVSPARPGRRGRAAREWATVADRYVRLLAEKSDVPVAQRLADELGVGVAQATNLVHAARKRGYLTPTVAGRAAGELTNKARRALEED